MPTLALLSPAAPSRPEAPAPAPPRTTARAFVAAWIIFWLLLMTVAVQDHLQHAGTRGLWKPLLWELSSCAVASGLAAGLWRQVPRLDERLGQPWRWLKLPLMVLPLAAPLFVAVVYALRHGVYALVGQTYQHAPWPQVLAYESVKFAVFYLLFVAVVFGLRSFAALAAERLRAEAGVALAREAQLAQLAQQIEPHFLFNALNTVASTIPEQPALAERLLLRLASLLRAATDSARRPQITLGEEVTLLQAYAEIMGQRFADRVHIEWHVDDALAACAVPALLLQPLLENAFRHGVEQYAGPVRIEVVVQGLRALAQPALATAPAPSAAMRVRATVSCSVGRLPAEPSFGVGLTNVQRRLELAYGPAASLRLTALQGGADGTGVCATVEWPCEAG